MAVSGQNPVSVVRRSRIVFTPWVMVAVGLTLTAGHPLGASVALDELYAVTRAEVAERRWSTARC